jgi:hypothetical protein
MMFCMTLKRIKDTLLRQNPAALKPTGEEIAQTGLEMPRRTMAGASFFNHPPMGTFTEAVSLAENLLIAKLNKEAQAKRQADGNLLRAAQTKALSTQ